MAKRTLRFRSALAALLVCCTLPARADVPLRSYHVSIDGIAGRPIAGYWDGAHVMVALEDVAADLGYRLKRDRGTRILQVNEESYSFSGGRSDVLSAGDPILQTTALPVEHGRTLFVAVVDLQTLLADDFSVTTGGIRISTNAPAQNVHTSPLQHPRVSTYTVRSDSGMGGNGPPAGAAQRLSNDPVNALIVHASIYNSGGFSSRMLSFSTEGARLRGNVDFSGFDNSFPALTGQVTVGTRDRYVQFGYESSPLNGLVFNSPGGYGVSIRQAGATYGSVHDVLGRTIVAMRSDRPGGALIFGIMRANGTFTSISGYRTSTDGIVKVTREVWLTSTGAAGSISFATQGRFFGEAVASGAFGNVPLTVGEAPDRLNLGFRVNSRVTLRGGLISGYGLRLSPYIAASIAGLRGLTGSLQASGNYRTASVSYAAPQASLSGSFTTSPQGASWAVSGSATQRRRLWEFTAYQSAGNQDDVVRTKAPAGLGLILGIERVVSTNRTRFGPVFGTSLPFGRSTFFELTEHPTTAGRALGFALTQRISFAPQPPGMTIGLEHAAAADLYVDDRLIRRIDAGVTKVAIPAGSRRVQARTADGNFASLAVDIDETVKSADVALLPLRQTVGRVIVAEADEAGRKLPLDHIQIVLEPGGVLAETQPDGSFIFPPTPTAANARVSIVVQSLPPGLSAGDDKPADALPLSLSVKTAVKVHRKIF